MPRPSDDDIRRIYRETIDQLYGFISVRCDGDRDLAEDVAQETWLRAVAAWQRDGLPDRPLAWLNTVAARILSNLRRQKMTDRLTDQDAAVLPSPEDDERLPLLRRALARLPLAHARLLRAFHFERRAVAEIARETGLSERAVEGRLRRARHRLRETIEHDVEGERSYE